jgi:hypothetical protein
MWVRASEIFVNWFGLDVGLATDVYEMEID